MSVPCSVVTTRGGGAAPLDDSTCAARNAAVACGTA
jgi:hypothetical protein